MCFILHSLTLHGFVCCYLTFCSLLFFCAAVRLLTNAPSDLPALLAFLSLLPTPAHDHAPWMSRYVLLLWLSLLAMVPFDLASLDESLLPRLIETAKTYLQESTGRDGDAAGLLLARVLCRSDAVGENGLEAFLGWCSRDVFAGDWGSNVYLVGNFRGLEKDKLTCARFSNRICLVSGTC